MLVLQGGGALGAYQAGVYQALHEAGIEPDWIIGTSIGAINASLIAGNEPENRLERLAEFWSRMEQKNTWGLIPAWTGMPGAISYWSTLFGGIPAFFEPNARPSSERRCRSAPIMRASIRPRRCARRWANWSTSSSSTNARRG